MPRTRTLVALAFVSALGLAACGSDDSNTPAGDPAPQTTAMTEETDDSMEEKPGDTMEEKPGDTMEEKPGDSMTETTGG